MRAPWEAPTLWNTAAFEPISATTALWVSVAASAASAVVGGLQSANAAKFNAKVAENDAIAARQAADFEAEQHKKRVSVQLSENRALIGASGLEMEGSPLLVQSELAADAALDELAIRYSGNIAEAKAKGQAAAERMAASRYLTGGFMQAGTSLLSGLRTSKLPAPVPQPKAS